MPNNTLRSSYNVYNTLIILHHDRLCAFVSDSNVEEGPLEFIVGDKKLQLHFDEAFYIE
nr:hypothetical protein Iba_chr02bCG15480 [Ipomoea batatas]